MSSLISYFAKIKNQQELEELKNEIMKKYNLSREQHVKKEQMNVADISPDFLKIPEIKKGLKNKKTIPGVKLRIEEGILYSIGSNELAWRDKDNNIHLLTYEYE